MNTFHIVFKALDPEMISAWSHNFSYYDDDVTVSQGEILQETADAIVSPANSFGYMDGGLDLVYSQYFGWELEKKVRQQILEEHDGELPVGQAMIVETEHPQFKYLISAPTMRVPMDISNTTNVYLAFRAILRAILQFNKTAFEPIHSVVCPALGTGEGRVPPARCSRQMFYAYSICILGMKETMGGLAKAVENHIYLLE